MRKFPELDAWQTDKDGHLAVWCQYCKAWHRHGAPAGHRIAHCWNPKSPYRESDYVLIDRGPAPPAVIADMNRRKPRGVVS
jgi:hypothetical protein